ncbi:GH92 family glycosyl hydrolase [Coralloluteibacterium stylophorae]|uniref:GH92 family glycosyl hydrolase n=1 Tax=Coralloluteibacterium stylophorae TaxID=1776034 RepID=A0A8J7VVG6_9GAMM|nr:GH92 family glycosyl hydrolase [Coralloluteibacterium stylophorae]MBS7455791.1 GH92 family glycosyl hydrolase [Coralloluteibacterium stylophorae]
MGVGQAAPAASSSDAYGHADPMIGTSGDGHTFPGATVPFGMIQLSPDTRTRHFKESYDWAAGYRHDDRSIAGFSHTHFSGSGHSDLGDVMLMPIAGDVHLRPGEVDDEGRKVGEGYRSGFRHDTETAEPGYYAVTLDDYGVRAELTANRRVGLHRYTFPAGRPAHVLLDLRHSIYDYEGKVLWSRVRIRPDGTVTGMRETRGWAPGRQLYFAMRFSAPPSAHRLENRETPEYKGFATPAARDPAARAQIEGRDLAAVFDFADRGDEPLLVKVAISTVSEDGAVGNLDADMPGWDFDATRAAARTAWSEALGAVEIDASEAMKTNLYTALYHTMQAPSLAMDADGRYRGPDNAVHRADGFEFHSTFSLWDTYRALHPLLTLVQPEEQNADFVNSLIAAREHSPYGILPVWSFHGLETWCMIGYHAVPVVADAIMKGIDGIDAGRALEAMTASAEYAPYGGLGDYMKLGWVAIDREPEAASKTLEYAFDDWTISRVARRLGEDAIAARYEQRAQNYRNVFDTATGFARAKNSDGSFREPFDPDKAGYGSDYTEGNAWQYSYYMPQDVAGLIGLMGGDRKLVDRLDAIFDAEVDPESFAHVEDISGLIGNYAHGNEPSHHMAYLYVYAGQPWRTQERLKQIVQSQYHPGPEGLVGNDDLGQMSAWLVFTALGFYPVAPGSNEYVIGRPFVERAVLNLPNGRRFAIETENLDEANTYVGAVTLDGEPLARSVLTHAQIMAGGTLRFRMQAEPNTEWGRAPEARPFSMSTYPAR